MKIELATIQEYESVIAFYDDVTARTPEMAVYARWSKGKHPTEEGIRAYIDEGSMYVYKEGGEIIAAMAVTMYQGEDYHAIEWNQQVAEAIHLAKANGMQAIRLDALASNSPAHKLYERLGFEYRGQQHLYAENTGWTDFYFFELKQ